MAVRTLIVVLITACAGLASGCGDPALDGELYPESSLGRPLPDGPVDEKELRYETRKRTPYFIEGPHQIDPPKLLPAGTRLQILDEPHAVGYIPIRTAGGLEAYIAADVVREISGRAVQVYDPSEDIR